MVLINQTPFKNECARDVVICLELVMYLAEKQELRSVLRQGS